MTDYRPWWAKPFIWLAARDDLWWIEFCLWCVLFFAVTSL